MDNKDPRTGAHQPALGYPAQGYSQPQDGEIDLRELFGIVWAEKWLVIGITAIFAIGSVIYALNQTDIYRAEAELAPADPERSGGSLSSQLGGAAALLGVNIGGSNGNDISTALATLRSRQFLGRFISDNDLLVPLFASEWDKNLQQAIIDDTVFDQSTGEWQLDSGAPTEHDAYRRISGILSVNGPDTQTGIVTVAIEWPNPEQAAKWVNWLVDAINQEVRVRDIQEAQNAIDYLQQQLQSTQLVDMQRVLYQLIESQTRITMLADVREEYVFRVIDPAVVPDQRSAPRRTFIVVIGTMIGGMLGLMIVIVRRLFRV
ncbi:Wzz/FepE/Etk N-terminal domain-containing protein [Pseudohongiella sp.]|uniref:Polysaccharide chain length determinant N-terminal domain-containing protein n=1 Tax=marine sediment metagenome TaxID=412755 RepID=A0A0F9YHX8_9ZZZZ|nr:Wzz/FepE/Etk N-terminal domain-containing protein [Pseudohongiella sp.]HDZ08440.1 LPS O-antigen length regulator [Pseudohongiella sp.]